MVLVAGQQLFDRAGGVVPHAGHIDLHPRRVLGAVADGVELEDGRLDSGRKVEERHDDAVRAVRAPHLDRRVSDGFGRSDGCVRAWIAQADVVAVRVHDHHGQPGFEDELLQDHTRAESNRLYGLATQTISYDVTTVAGYAQAVASGNEKLQEFFRASLVRAEFLDYLNTWEQQVLAGETPRNLLDVEEYLDGVLDPYRAAQDKAESDAKAADDAGRLGDLYTLSTVLLAVSLFFAGVTASFRSPSLRIALLAACAVTILISTARLADLPIAPATWTMIG